MVLVVKNPPANTGDTRDDGLSLGSGRSFGEGNGNPLQYYFLENPMERGALRAAVYRVTKRRTRLKPRSPHARKGKKMNTFLRTTPASANMSIPRSPK